MFQCRSVSFLVLKLVNKLVFGCLTGFLWGAKLYVICFGFLTYDFYILGFLSKAIYTCTGIVLWCYGYNACVLHSCACICSVQLSMSHMEKHYRNIIIKV